jgi:hypothetical protein
MKNPFRRLTVLTLAWVIGLCAGVVLLFAIGPQMQCAADPLCAEMGHRWWHTPLTLIVGLGPGVIATVLWWRSDGVNSSEDR